MSEKKILNYHAFAAQVSRKLVKWLYTIHTYPCWNIPHIASFNSTFLIFVFNHPSSITCKEFIRFCSATENTNYLLDKENRDELMEETEARKYSFDRW